MNLQTLERFLSKYKNIMAALGILFLLLNFLRFNLDVPKFFDQLDPKTQVLFMGFLSLSLIFLATIFILNRIDNQPLYKYTRLGEAGKRLVLVAKDRDSIDLDNFLRNEFQIDELKKQARILEDYGWITIEGNIIKITKEGDADLATFVDLVYGKFR